MAAQQSAFAVWINYILSGLAGYCKTRDPALRQFLNEKFREISGLSSVLGTAAGLRDNMYCGNLYTDGVYGE